MVRAQIAYDIVPAGKSGFRQHIVRALTDLPGLLQPALCLGKKIDGVPSDRRRGPVTYTGARALESGDPCVAAWPRRRGLSSDGLLDVAGDVDGLIGWPPSFRPSMP